MRVLTIGDIHGCHRALSALLDQVRPGPEEQIIFLGDYINRGPASRAVVDSLLKLKKTCLPVFLRGNHEMGILEAREEQLKSNSWRSHHGSEMVYTYEAGRRQDPSAVIPAEHLEFFEHTVRFHENDTHIFIHACLEPELEMDKQTDEFLFWETFDRLKPHKSGKRIVCGHTSQQSGQIHDVGFAVCIDTNPVSGGWLTCLEVNSGKYWQANEQGNTREGGLGGE